MDNSTLSLALTGVVPTVCDAEAGESEEVVLECRSQAASAHPAVGGERGLRMDFVLNPGRTGKRRGSNPGCRPTKPTIGEQRCLTDRPC